MLCYKYSGSLVKNCVFYWTMASRRSPKLPVLYVPLNPVRLQGKRICHVSRGWVTNIVLLQASASNTSTNITPQTCKLPSTTTHRCNLSAIPHSSKSHFVCNSNTQTRSWQLFSLSRNNARFKDFYRFPSSSPIDIILSHINSIHTSSPMVENSMLTF
jgi:hypothetical protein